MNDIKIIVIDDEREILNSIRRALREISCINEVVLMTDPEEAFLSILEKDYDVLITDQRMPKMSGLNLIEKVKKGKPEVQSILMSGFSDFDVIVNALNNGHITGFIMKPWTNESIERIICHSVTIKRERDFISYVKNKYLVDIDQLKLAIDQFISSEKEMNHRTVRALTLLIQAKDEALYEHSKKLGELARSLGHLFKLDEDQLEKLELGALVHDLGKIVIKDQIHYKDAKLDEDEFTQMKMHPVYGADILVALNVDPAITDIVRHHHEWVSGKGYPDGIKGDEIPLLTKIISVVDAYDAMTSDRVYRKGMTPADALDIIKKNVGVIYDASVYEKLVILTKDVL